jgi:hypothetical protein
MLKQTIYLFLRALIIGVLLNVGLQQVTTATLPAPSDSQLERPVSQSRLESSLPLVDPLIP